MYKIIILSYYLIIIYVVLIMHHLSQADYEKWWQRVETSKCYAESPLIGVYLDYNICVWRRTIKSSNNLNFACIFSAKTQSRQIHVLLDGASDSTRALDGHFSLVTDHTFSTGPNWWGCGKIPMLYRLGLHLESDPIDLVNIPDPRSRIG